MVQVRIATLELLPEPLGNINTTRVCYGLIPRVRFMRHSHVDNWERPDGCLEGPGSEVMNLL